MKIFGIDSFRKSLKTIRLNSSLGVEITNLTDITRISDNTVQKIKTLINKEGLVVIRGARKFTNEEQRCFTSKFGEIDGPTSYSTMTPSLPEVKKKWPNAKLSGLQWHSDRSYEIIPSYLSIFQMEEIPEMGNETSFICLKSIYDNLTDELKEKWSRFKVAYLSDKIIHPLIWDHPFNGSKVVYFDFRYVTGIKDTEGGEERDLTMKEVNQVIEHLQELYSEKACFYKHFWNEGDVIMVDNYAVAHKVTKAMADEHNLRMLIRTSVKGVEF